MNKKIIIAVAVIFIALCFLPFPGHGPDSFDEVLDHLMQEMPVAYYFEKEHTLKAERDEEHKIFRLRKGDFEKLCNQLGPEGWKSEVLFTTRPTGRVWILYGRNFPPFTVDWMKAHEKEATAEANRLIWKYRAKILLWFLGAVFVLLIVYWIYRKYSRKGEPGAPLN